MVVLILSVGAQLHRAESAGFIFAGFATQFACTGAHPRIFESQDYLNVHSRQTDIIFTMIYNNITKTVAQRSTSLWFFFSSWCIAEVMHWSSGSLPSNGSSSITMIVSFYRSFPTKRPHEYKYRLSWWQRPADLRISDHIYSSTIDKIY